MAENDGPLGVNDWFRSDKVEYITIMLQEHCAHKVLSGLGRLGVVQFTDLNPGQTVFQRRYVREVQRCDTIERKLKYLEEQMEKRRITPLAKPDLEQFLDRLETRHSTEGMAREQSNYMDNLEMHVDSKEAELVQLNQYNESLSDELRAQLELHSILEKAKVYASENVSSVTTHARSAPVGNGDHELGDTPGAGGVDDIRFRFLAGVCDSEDKSKFERMVFRSTRSNCLMRFYTVEVPADDGSTGRMLTKEVFFFFFQSALIQDKIKRIADAFGAKLHQIPELSDEAAIDAKSSEVYADIEDRRRVLGRNRSDISVLLQEVASFLEVGKWVTMREKAIYHTMNHFSPDVQGVLRAEGWVISAKRDQVVDLVLKAHAEAEGDAGTLPSSVSTLPESKWPSAAPTYFKTNKFTSAYQAIVDTYGVPRYEEANPAVMSVITFPFAFGIMFGDIGHGVLLFIAAVYMVYNEDKYAYLAKGEAGIIYGGRYMMVLMGFFATYCGFIYNDFFAMGLLLWPTQWIQQPTNPEQPLSVYFEPAGGTYPFGVDPTWHRSSNDLLYFNSVKMKMAVIFGVIQMTIGLIHRVQNAVFFNKRGLLHNLDLWFEALPMIVFMMSLFGYMCVLILYKWSLRWVWDNNPDPSALGASTCNFTDTGSTALGCDRTNCCNPPALITQLINIALAIGDVPPTEQLYNNQGQVQTILLLIAVIMVPLMLIPKPFFTIRRMKAEHVHDHAASSHGEDEGHTDLMLGEHAVADHVPDALGSAPAADTEQEGHSAGDVIVHQAIETIEFCLGCISNTASYLRLWALSLAHSQLASVFLEKALLDFITGGGAGGVLGAFIGYAVFAAITFAVLMLMDNLECFLHALRLHWVEFQNKFFRGDGVAFSPLSFRSVLLDVA